VSAIRGFLPWLLAAALVDWLGTGLFLAVSTVFFIRFVGLSVAEVGSGLTIAALAAMPTLVPAGRLADRFGPRNILILVEVLQGAATAGYLAVHGWWGFLAVTFLVAVTQQAAPPLIQALVGELAAGERRTKILAVHRTVINIGLAVGGLVAGVLLGSGLKDAFQVLLIADAAAFLIAAALVGALANPKNARVRLPSERRKALRDPRLLALSGYDAVMSLWQPMLNVAFPLWLITRTHAPVSLVGLLYGVACVCAIAFQYPASVLIATPAKALRGYSCAALCLAAASLGFAAAPAGPAWAAIALFTAAVIVLTFGEICQVGSAWTLSFAIAPPADRNAYLAAFSLGRAFSRSIGPLLMTGVVLAIGEAGWIALAAVFAGSAVLPVLAPRLIRPESGDRRLATARRAVTQPGGRRQVLRSPGQARGAGSPGRR
jgi:MFS family permease